MTLLFFSHAAFALQVSPETLQFCGRAGKKIAQKMSLKNDGIESLAIHVDFADGRAARPSWLKIPKDDFELKPGEKRALKFSCKIPKVDGEWNGALQIKAVPLKRSWYEMRSRHQIYVQVQGTQISDAKLMKVSARKHGKNVRIEVWVKNTGNVHIQPRLVAELKDSAGGKIQKIFDTPLQSILPTEQMKFWTVIVPEWSVRKEGSVSVFFHDVNRRLIKVTESFEVQIDTASGN